ncbi:putative lrr receptor-like serine/threonine-protein kinase, partial [Quercus suber]
MICGSCGGSDMVSVAMVRSNSEFAIKCGGPQITSSTGIIYERDNDSLNETTYYVTNTRKWAVTNAGYFTGGTEVYTTLYQYNSSNNSEFTNTLDSKLFQTARLSPSSLRYYGLGLFAEIAFQNSATWRSLGRRVFDIYIQGDLVFKDFDIKREAGGLSFRAVQKDFKVLVSENYLEIHLFWAGKGTCCIPGICTYGPSISAISATPAPDFILNVSKKPSGNKKNKIGLIVAIFVGAVGVLSFLFVFVGTLNDGRVVAVKQLSAASHQGKNQFITEIAIISAVQHRNLVKFGYLAPEYAMRGHLTEKADVFAFGIVALEIVSGRLNSDSSLEEEKTYLLEWAWQLHENNREVDLVDAKLSEFNEEEVKRVMGVSFLCTQTSPTLRPSMSRVVTMLLGDIEVSTVTSKPGYLTDWKFDDTTSLRNDVAARGTVSVYYDHSESTSM